MENKEITEKISERINEITKKDPASFNGVEFREAIGLFGGVFNQFDTATGLSGTWIANGAYWNSINSAGSAGGAYWSAWYWLSTYWFNKMQRYLGRWLYYSNAYASSAVDKLTILAMGCGFEYTSDNKSIQKRLDKWLKHNDYKNRSIEDFRRRQIDGETFFRIFNKGEDVRWVDPDLIFTSSPSDGRDLVAGIILNEEDNEQVEYYEVHDGVGTPNFTEVPPTEMQQRANKHFGQLRGFSRCLPVASDMFLVDELTLAMLTTAKSRAKIAAIREHEANQIAVSTFRSNIQAQPQNQNNYLPSNANGAPGLGNPIENIENYPAGSIIDTDYYTKWVQPPGIEAQGYEVVCGESKRKIATQYHLPMSIYTQDQGDRGAYAAELVNNSYLVRSIESLQHEQKEYDLKLLELCGFDIDQITVAYPEVAVVDKKAAIEEAAFLLEKQLMSRHTMCKTFNLDYDKEVELIKKEQVDVEKLNLNGVDNGNDKDNRNDGVDGELNQPRDALDSEQG